VEKIVHAGRQDLDLFALHAGQIPKPFFDTQIAAAMLGVGAQVAYANLVQRIHGTKLAEDTTVTHWSAMPQTPRKLIRSPIGAPGRYPPIRSPTPLKMCSFSFRCTRIFRTGFMHLA